QYFMSYLKFFIKCLIKVTILYIKKKYCIIHVNNMPDFLVFCAIIPKLCGTKIILDIHDPMPTIFLTKSKIKANSIKYQLLLYQEKLSSKFADSVLTVHEPIKQDILVEEGIPEQKIAVITNFADDGLFNINSDYSLEIPLKLIFHGTISERSGLCDVLKAIKNIESKHSFYLTIIGEGGFSIELKQLIKELDLGNIVNFQNKLYSYKELPDILKTFHIGLATYEITPATDYMLPVKMLEYLLLGIPFITVPNKAVTYYFSNEECFFYNPYISSSLTILLNDLIKNPSLILERREKLISIRKKFLWTNEEQKYINHLNRLRGF
ncbi:MAG: glycosyltransferase, partial [Candidatus Hodarchaeota archaeon]